MYATRKDFTSAPAGATREKKRKKPAMRTPFYFFPSTCYGTSFQTDYVEKIRDPAFVGIITSLQNV
jgi:hypothetical protein